jgi:hypothetical protein
MKFCKENGNYGLEYNGSYVSLISGKIVFEPLDNCIEIPVSIVEGNLFYKELRIPLPYNLKANLARSLFLLLGEVSNDIFYFGRTKIFVDSKIKDININVEKKFSKICGNYGSTIMYYCIGNDTFAILSPSKEEGERAFETFKDFYYFIRSLR